MALFVAALLRYRSDEHRPVLDRWSYAHAALIAGAIGLWLVCLYGSWQGVNRSRRGCVLPTASARWFDAAVFVWGLAYWLGALDAAESAGRIWDLNLFGSITPSAVLLNWGCLVALSIAAGTSLVRRLGARWQNPALSVAALWVVLLLGEGFTRFRALAWPATEGFPSYSEDLWERRYVQLNRLGFRDTDHTLQPPAGTRRLLLIGDSFAYGDGIDRTENRFGEELASDIARATGTAWEVINASHPDQNTLQEIALLRSALVFRPDAVVLLYVFNDIDYLRPVTERSALTEAPGTALQRLHPAYIRSRLLTRGRQEADQAYADSTLVWSHLTDLARFVTAARAAGAVVSIAPFDNTVTGDPSSRRRYETFVRWATAYGLPVWRMDRAFDGVPLSRLTVNRLDHHPNELANRLAERAVLPQALGALGSGQAGQLSSPAPSLP